MKIKNIFFVVCFLVLIGTVSAQEVVLDTASVENNDYYGPRSNNITFFYGDYAFLTTYDTALYSTLFVVKYKNKIIAQDTVYELVDTINIIDFNNDGKKNIIMGTFSGGAHCCSSLLIGVAEGGKFKFTDTLFTGNSGYLLRDIENDKRLEIEIGNDMFAYAFTNYAETRFPPEIYCIKNNKFLKITKIYPKIVNDYIAELLTELKEFTKGGFKCLGKDDDTFNTDAGSVKTILAAITACYYSIGNVDKGYELINKTYKCPDKDKFVKILKTDFKLK